MKPIPKNPIYTADERIEFVKNRKGVFYVEFESTHPDENMADFAIRASLFSQKGEKLWTRAEGEGIIRAEGVWAVQLDKTHTNYKVGLYAVWVETTSLDGSFQSEDEVPFHIMANKTPDLL